MECVRGDRRGAPHLLPRIGRQVGDRAGQRGDLPGPAGRPRWSRTGVPAPACRPRRVPRRAVSAVLASSSSDQGAHAVAGPAVGHGVGERAVLLGGQPRQPVGQQARPRHWGVLGSGRTARTRSPERRRARRASGSSVRRRPEHHDGALVPLMPKRADAQATARTRCRRSPRGTTSRGISMPVPSSWMRGLRVRGVHDRREQAPLHGEHAADEPRDAGGRLQVAEAGLDRADAQRGAARGPVEGGDDRLDPRSSRRARCRCRAPRGSRSPADPTPASTEGRRGSGPSAPRTLGAVSPPMAAVLVDRAAPDHGAGPGRRRARASARPLEDHDHRSPLAAAEAVGPARRRSCTDRPAGHQPATSISRRSQLGREDQVDAARRGPGRTRRAAVPARPGAPRPGRTSRRCPRRPPGPSRPSGVGDPPGRERQCPLPVSQ